MNNFFSRLAIIVVSIIVFFCVPVVTNAQNDSVNLPFKGFMYLQPNVGVSEYFGDINPDYLFNKNPKFSFGAALGYQLSPVFGLRADFQKTKLYSEKQSIDRKLSSNLWDLGLNLTVNINDLFAKYNEKRFVNVYLIGGAGVTSYKSKLTKMSDGSLDKEHTSWQHQFILPVGGGAAFRLTNNMHINVEYISRLALKDDKLDFWVGLQKHDWYSFATVGLQIKLRAKDTDGDGVKDKDDICVNAFGKAELAGCPDKDNDGIADKDDACPDVAGRIAFKGCPDTDGDGIPDKDDICPTASGKADLKGCPDKDGDGIADKDDKCPDAAGKKEFNGCPDRDGDGVIDSEDACPNVKGLAKFAGCPDTDGDGIPDNLDKCPDVAGVAATSGCPEVLKGALLEKIVYFNTDESVVLAKNILDLNEISAFMNENPTAVISVAGHTDNLESVEYNLRLSEKRADYVINYLKKKGMKTPNIDKTFFGKSNPVADNKTAAGRALNRRVEIKITK